jgi:hypothetical protein
VTDWGEEIEAGTNGKTNGDDGEVASNGSPLEVMFSSNNVSY